MVVFHVLGIYKKKKIPSQSPWIHLTAGEGDVLRRIALTISQIDVIKAAVE